MDTSTRNRCARPGCDCVPCVRAQIGLLTQNRRYPLVTPLVLAHVPPYALGLLVCRWGRA